jgi:signal transduction histidine kinase
VTLRWRLAATTAAIALPVIAALAYVAIDTQKRALEEGMARFMVIHMQQGGRAACEASPESWRGWPPPGPAPPGGLPPRVPGGLYAYDRQLRSQNPDAPRLGDEWREAIDSGSASRRISLDGRETMGVLVRMPWSEGPCALLLAVRPPFVGPVSPFPPVQAWLLPGAVVLIAVLLAVGPVVRRIRRLAREVQSSARAGYRTGVTVGGRDEVGELARAFDGAAVEIRTQMDRQEQRERTLRDFLENTTHDVMIPLTVLTGHLADMQDRALKGEPIAPDAVRSAVSEAHYMAALIHNLAAAAKLEAGAPAIGREPIQLGDLVDRAVARHRGLAARTSVALERALPDQPCWVRGDVTLVEQAVSNLVYNAIRFNRAGGHVAVVLELAGEAGFSLRVSDDGPGIPEAELARLVERGYRGDGARSRAPSGAGLGLHIARQVADVHGFRLRIARSEPGGLEVVLSGPVSPV